MDGKPFGKLLGGEIPAWSDLCRPLCCGEIQGGSPSNSRIFPAWSQEGWARSLKVLSNLNHSMPPCLCLLSALPLEQQGLGEGSGVPGNQSPHCRNEQQMLGKNFPASGRSCCRHSTLQRALCVLSLNPCSSQGWQSPQEAPGAEGISIGASPLWWAGGMFPFSSRNRDVFCANTKIYGLGLGFFFSPPMSC